MENWRNFSSPDCSGNPFCKLSKSSKTFSKLLESFFSKKIAAESG